MRKIIQSIPNAITSCNLLCGCLAIFYAIDHLFVQAFWLIIAAAVFDFFDGFAARMLKAHSTIGADLDSLADVVSFGVAPAVIAVMTIAAPFHKLPFPIDLLAVVPLLLAVFAALRLAKFNNDTRQTESFIGLPTPAMALFFASYALCAPEIIEPDSVAFLIIGLAFIGAFCWLMVSEIPMFSFKFKSFGFEENALRYLFAIFAVIAIVFMGYAAPAIIILAYILTSIISAQSAN